MTPRLAGVPAISHQPPQRLCNVCCTRPTDVWDECQWGSSLILLPFFVGSWSLSNIWTLPPPQTPSKPILHLMHKKKAVTRCKFRVNCAPRRWVVLTLGYLSPLHFTFYPPRHVFFFPLFFSPLHLSLLSTPPAPPHTSSPQNQISTALVSIATGYHGN